MMGIFRFRKVNRFWFWLILAGSIFGVRLTKGAGFVDAYAFLSRPFWPGPAQSEMISRSTQREIKARLSLLEEDNRRLRGILALRKSSNKNVISAAVIARKTNGWWHQLELSKGKIHGVSPGNAVTGPGGLLGIIRSTTPTTSRVKLLTAPGSRIGVWIARTKTHCILIGLGTNRPVLSFLDKNPKVVPGDLISTSPASTLMPPNLPVGVIQSMNNKILPAPKAIIELMAAPEAIDWVQINLN
tara:strand:+ start:596 stop:1324 length:729 start_codon:yes stop_codon:yes gene_type:complete